MFRCQDCGYSTAKWLGKCPECGKWNTLAEERIVETQSRKLTEFSSAVTLLSEISTSEFQRNLTGIGEFDRMLGGGIVPGSLTLLAGPPGIGKSTLMLQVAARLSKSGKVLYVSGEESQEQVKSRADRLQAETGELYLVSETNLENILEAIKKISPDYFILDSIQTTYRNDLSSAPGSVGQVRECAAEFLRLAKSSRMTVFLLGHVTKEGDLAGPRVLEHIVDTVLYFETEQNQVYRMLRAYKNRFGPTSEIGVFEMTSSGLRDVANPSELFLGEHRPGSGCVLISTIEGTRPLLLEIQSLVTRTHFGLPRRMVAGPDFNRVLLLIAVMEKRLNLNLEAQDVFVNITGGVKVKEPAIDLGIACAIASAFGNFSLTSDGIFVGEVGLAGEIRPVPQVAERVKEAERLGLSWAVVPKRTAKEKIQTDKIKVVAVDHLKQAVDWLRSNSSANQTLEDE